MSLRPSRFRRYLRSFPEEIYNLSDTSHIVRILDALIMGGVDEAKRADFVKRLQTSLTTMRFSDLDELYGDVFGLPRLEEEKYDFDVAGLLTYAQQEEIQMKDAKYRARIFKYMEAFQYGGTKKGIKLAAEAALGVRCEVVSCREYYQTRGIANGTAHLVMPIGSTDTANYDEYVIIAMTEQPLTAEQTYGVYTAAKRIRPVNALMTVYTMKDMQDRGIMTDVKDEGISPVSVTASSEWWNIDREITGRLDWDTTINSWVSPGTPVTAPRQIMVNSQEETIDFTSSITNAEASSEHIGHYNRYAKELFPALNVTSEMKAKYAIASAAAKSITSAIYGDTQAIEGYYPLDCIDMMTSYAQEDYRAYRYWSSVEAVEGEEWLEFTMERILPVNRIDFYLFRKPVKVYLYAKAGDSKWVRVLGEDYSPLVYTIDAWGGESVAGSAVGATFKFPPIEADGFRLVFERLDVPYFKAVGDGAYERLEFPYSIELLDFSVHYDIRKRSDFKAVDYTDALGNLNSLSLRVMSADNAISDLGSYWVSQPNVSPDAVEYLIFNLGEKHRVNRIDIDAVYSCKMNLYCSLDMVTWIPCGTYDLIDGHIEPPAHEARYIKMEFTNLCPIPYRVIADDIVVKERRFPKAVIAYSRANVTAGTGKTGTDMLLGTKSNYTGSLQGPGLFKGYTSSMAAAAYGSKMAGEGVSIQPNVVGRSEIAAPVRFETGEHIYDEKTLYRSSNLAYVVGIKSVAFSYESHSLAVNRDEGWAVNGYDENLIGEISDWEWTGERYYPTSAEVLGTLTSVDFTSVLPFRAFAFHTEQKEPVEKFLHPSDMEQDWHGYNADVASVTFGSSGTVLQAALKPGDTGIETDQILMSAHSMANINVEVFSNTDTHWILECYDGELYDESNPDREAQSVLFTSAFDIEKKKWTRLGTVFTPSASGTWWDSSFSMRLRIPVKGPVKKGDAIFCPLKYGINLDDLACYQLVYYNGAHNQVLDLDCTSKSEMWFLCQQDLEEGESATSFYNHQKDTYYGAYYLYFKTSGTWIPHEDYAAMFEQHGSEILDELVLADEGFIDFTYDGTGGVNKKYLFDYKDDAKSMKCYVYGKQIYVEIHDGDKISGYVSDLTSQSEDLFSFNPTHLLLQWQSPGSDEVYVDGSLTDQKWRRKIRLFANDPNEAKGYREIPCINNVYDETDFQTNIGEY